MQCEDVIGRQEGGEIAWTHNLAWKKFRDRFGEAVATDAGMQEGAYEWKRTISRNGVLEEALCCPEDVRASARCRHDAHTVCSCCDIPICNECWMLASAAAKIPKALACDNYIGYVHKFIVDEKVTWLEATIAAPVFSGLITYYIEGPPRERHNLMDSTLGKAARSYGVRGNIFSFLLPWEHVLRQLFEKVEDGVISPAHVVAIHEITNCMHCIGCRVIQVQGYSCRYPSE